MINNIDKNFFSKNNKVKLYSILLAGAMVATPFMAKGIVDKHIDNQANHNNEIVTEQQLEQEKKSRIDIDYEGEYSRENSVIIIYENKERKAGEPVEALGIITPNSDDPHCELPAGSYTVANYTDTYDIELDGETDYTLIVNYQDGSIINSNEKENKPSRTR